MSITIREKDFKGFFVAPFNAYPKDTLFVSLFKDDLKRFLSIKNPIFKNGDNFTYFTAYKDNVPVGRVLTHIHRESNTKYNWNRAYFGYFDVIEDYEVAKVLLEKVEAWAKGKGCDEILGNFNMTAMQQIGVTTEGFQFAPYTDQIYSPPHISKFLERAGYGAEFPMRTFEIDLVNYDGSNLLGDRELKLTQDSSYQFLQLTRKNIWDRLRQVLLILNDGFQNNPMFVPLTEEELFFQAKDMMLIIDERITMLIEHNCKPVGTIVCIPDLNPMLKETQSRLTWKTPYIFWKHTRKRKRALLIFASVNMEYQKNGLSGLMMSRMVQELRKAGYEKLGVTWVADSNGGSLRMMEKTQARPLHRQYLYRKAL